MKKTLITTITIIFISCCIQTNASTIKTQRNHPPTGDCEPKSYGGYHRIREYWGPVYITREIDEWSGSVGEGGSTS